MQVYLWLYLRDEQRKSKLKRCCETSLQKMLNLTNSNMSLPFIMSSKRNQMIDDRLTPTCQPTLSNDGQHKVLMPSMSTLLKATSQWLFQLCFHMEKLTYETNLVVKLKFLQLIISMLYFAIKMEDLELMLGTIV